MDGPIEWRRSIVATRALDPGHDVKSVKSIGMNQDGIPSIIFELPTDSTSSPRNAGKKAARCSDRI